MYSLLFLNDLDDGSDLHLRHRLFLDVDGSGKLSFCRAAEVECAVAKACQCDGCLITDTSDLVLCIVNDYILTCCDGSVDGIYAYTVAVILR